MAILGLLTSGKQRSLEKEAMPTDNSPQALFYRQQHDFSRPWKWNQTGDCTDQYRGGRWDSIFLILPHNKTWGGADFFGLLVGGGNKIDRSSASPLFLFSFLCLTHASWLASCMHQGQNKNLISWEKGIWDLLTGGLDIATTFPLCDFSKVIQSYRMV